ADGEAEAGAAVLAAGAAVRLLERLEDDLLLVRRDADAGVAHGDRERRARAAQHLVVRIPAAVRELDLERDAAALGELEGVGEQVLDDLLQALRVRADGVRQAARELEVELEALRVRHVAEGAVDVLAEVLDRGRADVDDDGARLDLGEVEDV